MRVQSFDTLKGFIIIVVVIVHLIFLSYSATASRSSDTSVVIQAFYTGLMVFFIISGYFFRPDRGFVNNTKKRIITLGEALIISNLILPLILFVELNLTGQGATLGDVGNAYWSIIGGDKLFQLNPDAAAAQYGTVSISCGHYFIQIMLVAFILFYALADKVLKDNRVAIATIAGLVIVQALYTQFLNYHLPLYMELVPIATAFMLFGSILGKYKFVEKFEYGGYKDKRFWIVVIGAVVAGFCLTVVFPPGITFDNSYFGAYGGWSAIPYFVTCGCLCVFFIFCGWLLHNIPYLNKLLALAGQHTLAILILHCFIIKMLTAPFCHIPEAGSWFPALSMVQILIVGVATIAAVIIITEYGPGVVERLKSRLHM